MTDRSPAVSAPGRVFIAASIMLAASCLVAPRAASAQNPAVTIEVHRSPSYGPHLTDGRGRALYMFSGDYRATGILPAASNCDDTCAQAWPPLAAFGEVRAAARAMDGLLGRIQRTDGSPQLTYNGWPLYTSADDRDPGQPTGHGTHRFGGGWYLVTPQGTRLEGQG